MRRMLANRGYSMGQLGGEEVRRLLIYPFAKDLGLPNRLYLIPQDLLSLGFPSRISVARLKPLFLMFESMCRDTSEMWLKLAPIVFRYVFKEGRPLTLTFSGRFGHFFASDSKS
ncbi:hypothetical protein G7Y79_00054g088690 [Physcia stellaris]|nr:hypothetical protein G7Y79_00054g088690 [Physcia stellaris]